MQGEDEDEGEVLAEHTLSWDDPDETNSSDSPQALAASDSFGKDGSERRPFSHLTVYTRNNNPDG
jgi:hypothetical protein